MQKVIAKLHLGSIRHNAQTIKRYADTKLYAVVKADAYGHGAERVVNALSQTADGFVVSLLSEAQEIKIAACGKDILILTPPLKKSEALLCAKDGFILTIPNLWTAKLVCEAVKQSGLPTRVHLKVNTGMNRYGMNACMLGKVCKLLKSQPLIKVEGVYSHLYGNTLATAQTQRRLFLQMQRVCKRYYPQSIAHLSATYGATLGKDFSFDGVRVGLGLYGYLPQGGGEAFGLKRAMEIYAYSMGTRTPSFGGAGYGEMQTPNGKLSVLRVGYADGFLRRQNNGIYNAENNANNLCMDVCLQKGCALRGRLFPVLTDAEQTARETGTIVYEVLCAATRRAERIYDEE